MDVTKQRRHHREKLRDDAQTVRKEGSRMGDAEQDAMIEEVMRHLDSESSQGVYRMSVNFDENEEQRKTVSHKCCQMYGRPASETVGLLDMYTDISAGEPDRRA